MAAPRPGPVTPARAVPRIELGSTRSSRHCLEHQPADRGAHLCLELGSTRSSRHCLEHQPRLEALGWFAGSARGSRQCLEHQLADRPARGQLTIDRLELGSAPAQGDSSWGGPHRLEVPRAGLCSGYVA
ncbi:hypothetical protein Salat_0242500 [Sesamum alatum]|uniref:Uncharacterized protein n=1 Tax=Sesamum alatum TaxID=300844 RepID=A0AAE1YZG4_9LAMI|nr:hypothetical protein Salat_0242500 [Sesamum alatum]